MNLKLLFLFIRTTTNYFSQIDCSVFKTVPENYFRLKYENDFFRAKDRYYTQGISASLIHPIIQHSPLSKALIKLGRHDKLLQPASSTGLFYA